MAKKGGKTMARNRNTGSDGSPFSQNVVLQVWAKGKAVPDYDTAVWRYDICGKPIKYSDYGNSGADHGWEIDHISPVSLEGGDELSNLQPLQWENNRRKGDTFPWNC